MNKRTILLIPLAIFFILFVFWSRFINLSWGYPYFFHPDENNIVTAIANISFPTQMDPKFFAYGSVPIYIVYFTTVLFSLFHTLSYSGILYILRGYSAFLSVGIIFSLFYIGAKLYNRQTGILAALLSTVSVGLIQYAHFGTFELWLSFFSLWFFYFSSVFWQTKQPTKLLLLGFIGGLLLGTKISLLPLLVLPLLSLLFMKEKIRRKIFLAIFCYVVPLAIVYLITNPFVIFDFSAFYNSIGYEGRVAVGVYHVFYTQSFLQTTPLLFQLLSVFPYLLNPFILVLLFISLFVQGTKQNRQYLLLTFLGFLFFSQAFLFVKWTRYMVPTLPFIYLLIAAWIATLSRKRRLLIGVLSIEIGLFYAIAYLHTTFLSPDTRILAAQWVRQHIPSQNYVLSEPYDLGILPFLSDFKENHMDQFDFYALDTNPALLPQLQKRLQSVSVIILPSQRLMRSRLRNPSLFPLSAAYYQNLFSGKLGYHKVYQTPCNIVCKIVYMGNPIFSVEETANVFDRPTVFIFEKNK